jgi:PhzF family phenazine biosynthesis protein
MVKIMSLYKVSAFTKNDKGGNAAGVYIHADQLKENDMQKIAKDLGFSETAFVLKSDVADFKVRFFTPTHEVDLCGHATIATFYTLKALSMIKNNQTYMQETNAGLLKIRIENDEIFMQQNLPKFYQKVNTEEIAQCFDKIVFHSDYEPYVVSTGMKEIFVPIKNKEMIDELNPNFENIKSLSLKNDCIGLHVFAIDDYADAYGRNFAPVVGINEESATGTSNGALACYLSVFHQKKTHYTLRQGDYLNQASEIKVSITYNNHDEIDSVWVGGKAQFIK